jgi:hypothetical protein
VPELPKILPVEPFEVAKILLFWKHVLFGVRLLVPATSLVKLVLKILLLLVPVVEPDVNVVPDEPVVYVEPVVAEDPVVKVLPVVPDVNVEEPEVNVDDEVPVPNEDEDSVVKLVLHAGLLGSP